MIVAVCTLIATILFFDQLCKFLILKYIGLNTTFVLIKGVLSITPILNTGGGFGILPSQTHLFILVSLLTIIFITLIIGETLQHKKHLKRDTFPFGLRTVPISLSLILAGALGNLIDRVRLGAVIDFIDFKIWPVFNIADSSITIGTIILAWVVLFKKT